MGAFGRLIKEISGARRIASGPRSFSRWATDIIAYRLLRLTRIPGHNRLRTIHLKDGTTLSYRLTRGDLLVLREVWLDEVYRSPGPRVGGGVAVDLGANIGLASVWLAQQAGYRRVVAVEPLPENIALLRRNLQQNAVSATVMEGAVGPSNGQGHLEPADEPCSGRVAASGLPVTLLSMDAVLGSVGAGENVDLVKIDIEGSEEELFAGELGWLDRVGAMLVEIHPDLVDVDRVVQRIESCGLQPIDSQIDRTAGAVTSFVRG
jgi:FkbM family methyltransferase